MHRNDNIKACAIKVELSRSERKRHSQLQRQAQEERKISGAPDTPEILQLVGKMLQVSSEAKAPALAGLVSKIKKHQETMVLTSNAPERATALAACREAGRTPMWQDKKGKGLHTWMEHGGIIVLPCRTAAEEDWVNHARHVIFFGRPASRELYRKIRRNMQKRSLRRMLEETHIIALNSADHVIAQAVMAE